MCERKTGGWAHTQRGIALTAFSPSHCQRGDMTCVRRVLPMVVSSLAAFALSLSFFLPSSEGATTTRTRQKLQATTPIIIGSSTEYTTGLKRVIRDLDAYWSAIFPQEFGLKYEPVSAYYAADPKRLPPSCGSRVRYRDIAGNAFFCASANYIAFDNQGLFPDLYTKYGPVALGIVLAHEMGHVVQARTGTQLPSVYTELQADCYSGAWLRRLADGKVTGMIIGDRSADYAIATALSTSDHPGISASTPGAHGNGFDRIGALQLGYAEGSRRCASFETTPPLVTENSFSSWSEALSGGNVSFNEAVSLATSTAKTHFGGIAGFEPTITVSTSTLTTAFEKTGDVGTSMVLVLGWADQARQKLRMVPGRSAASPDLQASCLAGTWLGAAYRGELSTPNQPLSLSPGDLDEAVAAVILTSGKSSTFDRVRAMRTGFLVSGPVETAGMTACGVF
jgi:predicted metalloprotease